MFSKSSVVSLLFALLVQSVYVLGQDDSTTESPHGHPPNKTAAITAGALWCALVAGCIVLSTRHRARYMLGLIIGSAFYALGLFLRVVVANDMESTMKYALMTLIILLSPCAFIACVYMLLGRLAIHLDAVEFLVIRPQILTKVFVFSDVATFLVQAAGGGMTAGNNADMRDVGRKIFLVGLIAQMISFIGYTLVFALFVYRMWCERREEWNNRPQGIMRHWLALVVAMIISCITIIIRSAFRTAENAQGRNGELATKEVYFYTLDCAMLWVSVAVFVVTWPPKYLTNYRPAGKSNSHVELMTNVTRA